MKMMASLFAMTDCASIKHFAQNDSRQKQNKVLDKMKYLIDLPTTSEFLKFQQLVVNRIGVFLPQQKRAMLGHRLIKRIKKIGCDNFTQYYDYISSKKHQDELQHALELITTNETFFFREEKHFDFLVSSLLKNYSVRKPIRVWSSACSSGEEPYSLAMTLDNHCYADWSIVATDVNTSVLNTAIKGIYPDERTSGIPNNFRKKYCRKGVKEFSGYLRITPNIREKVLFKQFNLLDDMSSLGSFDIIFLRNVMIYFNDETKQSIIQRIAKQLAPNGWLIIGHSESLYGISEQFKLIKPSIYQRI